MSIIKDINVSLRELAGYSKAYIPLFSEELVTADIDAVKEAMTSSERVRVFRKRNWLFRSLFIGFEPLVNQSQKGLILYPGAFVAPKAYSPITRTLAEHGYYAAVTTPPLELSLTDVDLADDVKRFWRNEVDVWALAGHSLGGMVAAAYANEHVKPEEQLRGLVMLASYPSERSGFLEGDVSDDPFTVTSIYGTVDGLTTLDEIDKAKPLLPPTTKYVPIEGGNHTQFYYANKLQEGDNQPEISREKQQQIIRQNILMVLESL
ncbi:MAG: alpha/beta fold hydrolase [Xenococcaceae cyanobacterium MO_188.B29]|nr:alpha/beta fold hydrolase [Xenococcaceae cyanobacterium MO_188.B29]